MFSAHREKYRFIDQSQLFDNVKMLFGVNSGISRIISRLFGGEHGIGIKIDKRYSSSISSSNEKDNKNNKKNKKNKKKKKEEDVKIDKGVKDEDGDTVMSDKEVKKKGPSSKSFRSKFEENNISEKVHYDTVHQSEKQQSGGKSIKKKKKRNGEDNENDPQWLNRDDSLHKTFSRLAKRVMYHFLSLGVVGFKTVRNKKTGGFETIIPNIDSGEYMFIMNKQTLNYEGSFHVKEHIMDDKMKSKAEKNDGADPDIKVIIFNQPYSIKKWILGSDDRSKIYTTGGKRFHQIKFDPYEGLHYEEIFHPNSLLNPIQLFLRKLMESLKIVESAQRRNLQDNYLLEKVITGVPLKKGRISKFDYFISISFK